MDAVRSDKGLRFWERSREPRWGYDFAFAFFLGQFKVQPQEERLDATREKSLAVHGVFGLLTPWLCHLDREWFISVRDLIFPCEIQNQEQWVAAWITYVGWNHVDKPVFEAIEREYWRAIEHLDLLRKQETGRQAIEGMGEHLIMLYAMGLIPLFGEKSLLQTFLEKANSKERGHVMWYTGRALENTGTILDEIKQRLSAYWESRLESATCASSPEEASEELSHFCWWFRSGKLENRWCLMQIQALLRVSSSVPEAMSLLEDLAKIASQYPTEAVTCLQVLVSKITLDRYVYLEEGHTKAILCAAMESKLPEAVKIAESTHDELLRLGRFEYKNLRNTQNM